MGVHHRVYIGPYATYKVPADFRLPDGVIESLQAVEPSLDFHHYPPTVEVGGVTHERRFWTPYYGGRLPTGEGCPDRQLEWNRHGPYGDHDLTAVDWAAEIRWLQVAFAPQLAALTAGYGLPPTFGWGVVSSAG